MTYYKLSYQNLLCLLFRFFLPYAPFYFQILANIHLDKSPFQKRLGTRKQTGSHILKLSPVKERKENAESVTQNNLMI